MSSSFLFEFGSSLVEITAMTALIETATAESLISSGRSAAGIPCAAMSSFGSIFMIRACISTSTLAWMRSTIGMQSARVDAAVWLIENLDRTERGVWVGCGSDSHHARCR
ncbi:hypothetical protein BDY21DRAFT_358157 [Lineolata rhizophorae]|uniref:Uncharacterized protein n=1 Tax=Lineolata rhizophorae TaxID=578093 RepID=A0A6A6NMM7_9PEZI|nr:hypothetical protein BDY21DRAFT_358157 [Lineolata rhizophorae]